MLRYYFSLRQFRLIKWSFSIHSTTPYIHPRLDSGIEPKFSDWQNDLCVTVLVPISLIPSTMTGDYSQTQLGLPLNIPFKIL